MPRIKIPVFMSLVAVFSATSMLSACGSKEADREASKQQAAASPASPPDPEFATFAEIDLPDPDPRSLMQLQVVLDRQGFGPGVIDGVMDLPTRNALKGFQEASGLDVTGELDASTRQALERWNGFPATRVVRIPEIWARVRTVEVPEDYADQAKLDHLGYESLGEKLAERFHTTVEVLQALNPGGQPAGMPLENPTASAVRPTGTASPVASAPTNTEPVFRPGQLVRVPNVGVSSTQPTVGDEGALEWARTLASLGVSGKQPKATRVVVDKSDSWLKAYDAEGKLVGMFTVTSGSGHDPLPLGEWGINVVDHNPPFRFDPDLFWDVADSKAEQLIPPGPNGPVGVVWIDLTKEHYGIHGTPEPQNIGVTQSHGCVRLTNWDAARLAGMVSTQTKVLFQA